MCLLCELNRQIKLNTGGYDFARTAIRTIATNDLIAEDLASFTLNQANRDGFIDLYLHTSGGSVEVGGGVFGSQTIITLPISSSDQQFFKDIVSGLDELLDLDFRFTSNPNSSDINLYYDTEIGLDGGETLGLASSSSKGGRNWWELFLNIPAFEYDQNHLRYALIHEFGHSLGLEHPFDDSDGDAVDGITDPWRSVYPEDTVMAYRNPLGKNWPNAYTSNDLEALISIWGRESNKTATDINDSLEGTSQRDNLIAFSGNNKIFGYQGNDEIYGKEGNDEIYGNQGNDTLYGNQGDDISYGGQGDDVIFGGKDADYVYGNKRNDTLYGNKGNDYLYGGQGDDTLFGGENDDVLDGNKGNDNLSGNLGADKFIVSFGSDVAKDYIYDQGDSILAPTSYSISTHDLGLKVVGTNGSLLIQDIFDESNLRIEIA
tara:strand:- start:484 stop:1776 length:1293 start_codon:yes stop_codon:yes gene_type:complete